MTTHWHVDLNEPTPINNNDDETDDFITLERSELVYLINTLDDKIVEIEMSIEQAQSSLNQCYSMIDEFKEFLNNS